MRLSTYTTILDILSTNINNPRENLRKLSLKYPEIPKQTLGSIYAQDCQRRTRKVHWRHTLPEKMDEYYFRYCEESQHHTREHVILHLAHKVGLSPALMARIILERHLAFTKYNGQAPHKSEVSQLIKDTSLIDDPVLAMEIDLCVWTDDVYGPVADTIKHSVGHEYEFLLQLKLDEAKLSYQDENRLRAKGYDKTPDVILEIPIAIDGKVVNWIESKASFGDQESHESYLRDQFWSYWNRFGPGLVIYWFGFIEELDVNREKGIMLADRFPEVFTTVQFPDTYFEQLSDTSSDLQTTLNNGDQNGLKLKI